MRHVHLAFAFVALAGMLCAVAAPTSAADNIPDPIWLRQYLETVRDKHHLPSLAAALVIGDKVVAASAVGVRRWGSPEKATRDDAYHLGSVAKPLTATMIARLVEQKKIKWDTTIREMFPELIRIINPAYRRVTVVQLLSHSSGMPYQPKTPESLTDGRGRSVHDKRYEYVKAAVIDPPEAPPGTKMIYGGGPVIVACALERTTQKFYEQLMRELVFEPLGMTAAGFGAQATPGKFDKIDGPWDHELKGGTPVPVEPSWAWELEARAPVGRNVHCSVIDLARFCAVHLVPGKYLSPESISVLHSPVPPVDYGPGWALGYVSWAKGRILWHGGSAGRNHALVHVVPEEKFATCVLTNIEGEGVNAACDEVNLFLADKVHKGLPVEPGVKTKQSSGGKAARRPS